MQLILALQTVMHCVWDGSGSSARKHICEKKISIDINAFIQKKDNSIDRTVFSYLRIKFKF